jgi:hypothetical protein
MIQNKPAHPTLSDPALRLLQQIATNRWNVNEDHLHEAEDSPALQELGKTACIKEIKRRTGPGHAPIVMVELEILPLGRDVLLANPVAPNFKWKDE